MGVSDGARDGMASSVSNLVMSRLRSQQWGDRSAGRVRQRHELMRQRMDSQLVLEVTDASALEQLSYQHQGDAELDFW